MLVAVFAAFLFFRGGDNAQQSKPLVLNSLPNVILKDQSGADVSLDGFRDVPMVLGVWTSWCSLCDGELQSLIILQKEFGDRIHVVSVNRGESQDMIKKYMAGILGGEKLVSLLDANDELYRAIGGFSMPEILFVDAKGLIHAHTRGPSTLEEMRRHIQDIL